VEWTGASFLSGYLVNPVAYFVLRRFDIDAVFFCGGRDESPHAVRLPVGRFNDLGECGTLRPGDYLKDLRALAGGTRCPGTAFGPGGIFVGLCPYIGLLWCGGFGFRLGTLGGFLGLEGALLLAGGLLRVGLLRRDVRALCRNGGVVGSVGFCGRHLCGYPSALVRRMTIHHSCRTKRQAKMSGCWWKTRYGEHVAIRKVWGAARCQVTR
jgi:hypothetical protein